MDFIREWVAPVGLGACLGWWACSWFADRAVRRRLKLSRGLHP